MGGGMKQPLRWAFTCAAVAVTMAVCAVIFVGPAVAGRDIPWKGSEIFNRVSVDEDIKDTLRRIISQNGQEAVFRPGVESSVSFDFSNMPLEAAFNKLITENGLDYDYDSKTGLITVFSASERERVKAFQVDFDRGSRYSIKRHGETANEFNRRPAHARGFHIPLK